MTQPARSKRNYSVTKRAFGDICVYCGGMGSAVDHVVPWSYNADQSRHNLVIACRVCNSIAGSLVFQSFDDKRAYIRQRRTELGYSCIGGDSAIADEPDTEDNSGELVMIDAIWEAVDEPGIEDDSGAMWTICAQYVYIHCGARTSKGTPCKLDILNCPFH